jgi:diguanylate cyclase (GGDEF)-like protein
MLGSSVFIGMVAVAGVSLVAGTLFALKRIGFHRALAEDRAQMLNNLSEGVYRSSIDGKQISANRALVRLNGFSSEKEMLETVNRTQGDGIAQEWYVDPQRRAEFQRILYRDGEVRDFVSEIHRHKTRERIWISENARLVLCPKTGAPLYYEGTVRDISETVARNNVEQRFNKLADIVPGGLFQMRLAPDGRFSIPYMSRPFVKLLGLPGGQIGTDPRDQVASIHPQDKAAYLLSLDQSARMLAPWRCSFRFRNAETGTYLWVEVSASVEREADGGIIWSGMLADVSDQKRMLGEIERLAYHDILTELPNRRLFVDRVAEAVKINKRRRRHGAVIFIDLDGFKKINDTYGHQAGDRFIRLIGGKLSESVRESDTVSRLGGDEFVILLHDLDSDAAKAEAGAVLVAEKLIARLAEGVPFEGDMLPVGCSMGITMFSGRELTPDQLITQADQAMYRAKALGRGTYVLHADMAAAVPAGREKRLRRAAANAA